jgi:hypothetical protein
MDDSTWAENGTWWSAIASENVDEVKEGLVALEISIKEDKLSPGELAVSWIDLSRNVMAALTGSAECESYTRISPLLNWGPRSSHTHGRRTGGTAGCQTRPRPGRYRGS